MEPDCDPAAVRRHDNTLPAGGSASQGRGGRRFFLLFGAFIFWIRSIQ
jgi:hypothetical protein